jgi:hypothetical protein
MSWSLRHGYTAAFFKPKDGSQHATDDRDRLLADALGQLASGEIISLRRTIDGRSSQENMPGALTQTADQEEMQQPQRDVIRTFPLCRAKISPP